MTNELLDAISSSATDRKPLVWLDSEAYGRRVVLNGAPLPWNKPTEFISAYGQIQSLLKPGVAPVNLGHSLSAWLNANQGVLSEMGGKKRIRYALRKLLAMDSHRTLIREIVSGLCQSVSQPLVLVLPANGHLINWANQMANSAPVADISDVDVDTVSVYLADYLRNFNGLDVAGVLVQVPDGTAINPEFLELYSPIVNVAKHYHWTLGMQVSAGTVSDPDETLQFVITDEAQQVSTGVIQKDSFWSGEEAHWRSPGFVYAEVPEDLDPEQVLERLSTLR